MGHLSTRESVSLFFSDMASFTSIVESLKPEDTLVLLSRYFNDMSDVIDRFGGVVIEFIGDAIYAVFGAPIRNNNHAEACVKAMLKMQRGVQKINHWSQQLGLPHVSIRCGVHTGWVRVGNIGFHSRLKFGCMGDNANVPSRLEELNKSYGTGNLISEATWNRLPREEFVLRPVDFVDLSYGEELEEMVFEVIQHLGSSRPSPRFILRDTLSRKYERALKLYVDRKFDKAAGAFREVSLQMGQHLGIFDKASVVMRKRASYYQFHPPPNTWRGIWNLSREPDEKDGINEEAVFVCI
ncbi:unnamed protein product [Effrenium voratum]|uniref:Guanylate cyclase domain-containing protein n=1 Tax=Effrenium voratum TaxID=2562239 RepID=A0AA36J1Q6_9DINO|nr:unnamed protein product [Effrenium voratum]